MALTQTGADEAAACGKRILVVDDEVMIRMLLVDMLSELGYTVTGEATRLDEALKAAQSGDFDVAILDVNLHGQTIEPVAEAIAESGRPFVFATGYNEMALPENFRDRPMLRKPFQMDGLCRTLETALAGRA